MSALVEESVGRNAAGGCNVSGKRIRHESRIVSAIMWHHCDSDLCDSSCPGRECLLLCGPAACDPAVCPTATCSPLCTAINGGVCNPACPTSPCEEVCGGNPCHDDCPAAACNPICDPNPCNPDCCRFDDGNPCTRDCCEAGNLCITDDRYWYRLRIRHRVSF
ncbi:MAG: hypothetical protein HOP29_05700 [Phycisphaerales bacterium]|nr:hypothetical protein [Phycisphaerales bacterium]